MYDSGTASGMCPERSASMPWLAGAPGAGEVLVGPGHFQGNEIQEFHGGSVLADGIGGDLALVEEIELILADGLYIEIRGAGAEILGEGGYLSDILLLGADCQVAQLHIVDHALT